MTHAPQKTCYLVVGLPRSGTSSVAQLLDHLGVHFGDPAHFLDTSVYTHNPVFYELQWVNEFNDRVIAALGTTYVEDVLPIEADFDRPSMQALRDELRQHLAREFGPAPLIGVKDPRICFTFPLWRRTLAEAGYALGPVILTLRSASAILKSNRLLMPGRESRWQRFYARHLLAVRYFTRDVPVVQFDFDRLMQDPLTYAAQKAAEIGLPMPDPDTATRHLSRQHYHHQPDPTGTGDPYVDRIDADLRAHRLDPDEYLAFRSIARLFTTDLAEQDRQIQQALREKDAHIAKLAALSTGATSEQAQHIAKLEQAQRNREHEIATQLAALSAALQLKDAHIDKLQAALVEARQEFERHTRDLSAALAAKDAHIVKLDAATEALRAGLVAKEQHIVKLETLIRDTTAQHAHMRDDLAALRAWARRAQSRPLTRLAITLDKCLGPMPGPSQDPTEGAPQ